MKFKHDSLLMESISYRWCLERYGVSNKYKEYIFNRYKECILIDAQSVS